MVLKEKERSVIEDLQNQEKSCMEKYAKYADLAKDPELKALFKELHKQEQKHYDSLGQVLPAPFPIVTATTVPARIIHQKPPTTI